MHQQHRAVASVNETLRQGATRESSIALHQACGFVVVGTEREVGRKFSRWLDATIMQTLL